MRLQQRFKSLKENKQRAFIPYICAGDPDPKATLEVAERLIKAGADVLELGLAFSDPIADGPTIQKSGQRALEAKINTDKYFKIAKQVHKKADIPLVSMTYYNLVLQYGLDRFAGSCRNSGVTGLIVPDLPVEESTPLLKACRRNELDLAKSDCR